MTRSVLNLQPFFVVYPFPRLLEKFVLVILDYISLEEIWLPNNVFFCFNANNDEQISKEYLFQNVGSSFN